MQIKTWFQNRRTKWKKQINEQDRAESELSRLGNKSTEHREVVV